MRGNVSRTSMWRTIYRHHTHTQISLKGGTPRCLDFLEQSDRLVGNELGIFVACSCRGYEDLSERTWHPRGRGCDDQEED